MRQMLHAIRRKKADSTAITSRKLMSNAWGERALSMGRHLGSFV
jgi:hypothetical protein